MTLLDQALKSSKVRTIARAFGMQLRDRRQFVFDMLPAHSLTALIGMYRPEVLTKLVTSTRPQRIHLVDPLQAAFKSRQNQTAKTVSRRTLLTYCKNAARGQAITIHDASIDDAIQTIGHNGLDWVYINRVTNGQIFSHDLAAAANMVRPGGLVIGDDYDLGCGHVKRSVDKTIASGILTRAIIKNNIFVLKKYLT